MTNRTFAIIKPNAVAAGTTGKILDAVIEAGFKVIAMKLIFMSRNQAEKFYSVHKGREFFNGLVEFTISGPAVVLMLEKDNAVADLRELVGATDPAKAEEGTIRQRFGETLRKNSIHASDSDENAAREAAFFFTEDEIVVAGYAYEAWYKG